MALDGVSKEEIETIPLQGVAMAIAELGSFVQTFGEADIAKTVIILTLTKPEESPNGAPILEVMFAGHPEDMAEMMKQGEKVVKELAKAAGNAVCKAEYEARIDNGPWKEI